MTLTIGLDTSTAYGKVTGELLAQEKSGSRAGEMREILDVEVVSDNPRSRWLVRDDSFNLAFALQESFAYWRGLNPGHVERYNSNMETWINDSGVLPGSAYGDRMRNTAMHDQIKRAIDQLRTKPETRRAVIAVYQPAIEDYNGNDVACTVYLQPFIRDGELHMFGDLRSQDMYWGYPYDVQNNQFIQEALAGILGVNVGTYYHRMNSCHFYTEYEDDVSRSRFRNESYETPDMRLPEPELNAAMDALDDGLAKVRSGIPPFERVDHLRDELHETYADWLAVIASYDMARHHHEPEVARDLAGAIELGWWNDWAMKKVEHYA